MRLRETQSLPPRSRPRAGAAHAATLPGGGVKRRRGPHGSQGQGQRGPPHSPRAWRVPTGPCMGAGFARAPAGRGRGARSAARRGRPASSACAARRTTRARSTGAGTRPEGARAQGGRQGRVIIRCQQHVGSGLGVGARDWLRRGGQTGEAAERPRFLTRPCMAGAVTGQETAGAAEQLKGHTRVGALTWGSAESSREGYMYVAPPVALARGSRYSRPTCRACTHACTLRA